MTSESLIHICVHVCVCVCVYIPVCVSVCVYIWVSLVAQKVKFTWRKLCNPLQYSCLENPMDRGAWRATVHEVTKSQTRLSD